MIICKSLLLSYVNQIELFTSPMSIKKWCIFIYYFAGQQKCLFSCLTPSITLSPNWWDPHWEAEKWFTWHQCSQFSLQCIYWGYMCLLIWKGILAQYLKNYYLWGTRLIEGKLWKKTKILKKSKHKFWNKYYSVFSVDSCEMYYPIK